MNKNSQAICDSCKISGSGYPVVLVHGFLGSSEHWQRQLSGLKRHGKIIAPTLPGFGDNRHLLFPDSIAEVASIILKGLSLAGIQKFVLLGHSMGGMIAQEMTRQESSRITALVLYGTGALGALPGRFETLAATRHRIEQEGVAATTFNTVQNWLFDGVNSPAFKRLLRIAKQAKQPSMLAALTAMEKWNGVDFLPFCQQPTLILWGANDRSYPFSQTELLWRNIPAAALAVIPHAGHAAHAENPVLFNQLIKSFLLRTYSLNK